MAETAVDFLLERLNQVRKGETHCPFSAVEMNRIECLYEEVEPLRTCLEDLENNRTEHQKIEDLLTQIRDAAYEAADIIDLSLVNDDKIWHSKLSNVLSDIISREKKVKKICEREKGRLEREREMMKKPLPGMSKKLEGVREMMMKEQLTGMSKKLEREREKADTAVDLLLENLHHIIKGEIDCLFSIAEMNRIARLYEELQPVRTCLMDTENNHGNGQTGGWKMQIYKDVEHAVAQIRYMACDAANIIDASLVTKISHKDRSLTEKIGHRKLSDVLEEFQSIKKQVMEIYDQKLYGIGDPQVGLSFRGSSSRASTAPNVEEELVVGFDRQVEMLKDRLITTGIQNHNPLEVVSIVGMAGLGKTTLARKLYNDPFIVYHFYIRGWASVSQVYRKRDLLLAILTSVFMHKDELYTASDEKLGEELYKGLKGKRYLVVMDDMWHIRAWNDFKIYFPNDNNASRILFTSRHTDVALHASHDGPPHHLPFLNEDESWDLLQKKIFWKESCPPELMDIGKQIAKKCQGLPLAIVVVAGLLAKTDKIQDWWKQVAENLSSYIVSDTEQCMDILALSYNNLPHHLRLCFLYFGAFPEDYEISVRKLIWLWIAEGFIQRAVDRSLEDVAEDYLMDLIDRNLVLVAKRRSTGGIRACHVHDLLHDLCLRKAKEEKFLKQIYKDGIGACCGYDQGSSSSYLVPSGEKHRRLSVNSYILNHIFSEPFAPHIRSFLCFVSEQTPFPPKSMSFIYPAFKLLGVLDLSAISIISFPCDIVQLFLLRYLALQGKHLRIPTSIENLQNLEMLIISQGEGSFIPNELWNIVTLRHLRIAGKNYVNEGPTDFKYSFVLYNLQTISFISPTTHVQGLLARTPNLRKLGFCGNFDSEVSDNSSFSLGFCGNFDSEVYDNSSFPDLHFNKKKIGFPDLHFLKHLETLKLLNRYVPDHHSNNLQGVKFPPNLKSLTLSNTALEWTEMSVLGELPNLEVLKLEFQAFIGSLWETSDGGFHRLKYLRLYYMTVEQWNASSIHFPSLQHLVLHRCRKLKEIPFGLGDICTLRTIEVSCCSDSSVNSAREIKKEQEGMGNDSLKIIIINPADWELKTYF